MSGKVVVSVCSIILVVGVALGVVAVVHHKNGENKEDLSPQMKAVTNFCSSADYQDACQKSLSSVNSTDPKEYIEQSILAAQDAVKKFFNYSDSLIVQANNDSRTKMALDDCKDMMDLAIDSLQASFSDVGDAQLHNINDRINDLRTWLSAVIAYQQACLDGFEDGHSMKKGMSDGMTDASQLTANALAIVTKLSDILSKFGLQLNVPAVSRRLLSVDKDGYPSWFSAADRKLLSAVQKGKALRPNAVVAKDGSGQFRTIAAALAAAPKNSIVRHVIYVKAGVYNEYITVDKKTTNILMYGDGPTRTIVTGRKNNVDGVSTWQTATFSAVGNGFIAKDMGFENSAGPQKHQAVALRVQSDRSAFFNCRMDGFQDTLYNHANRQFYRDCVITGTVDFIFGDSPVIIQNSLIIVRRPLPGQKNTVTAQGKQNPNENTALVLQNCRIVPERNLFADRFAFPTFLGRPWKKFATTIIMESELADFIQPEGWMKWDGANYENTCYSAEYNNRGPGANVARRVKWKGFHVIDKKTAMRFTVQSLLTGRENWLPATGVPFLPALQF